MALASTRAQVSSTDGVGCRYEENLEYEVYVTEAEIKSPNYDENGLGRYCHNIRMVRMIKPGLLLHS